MFLTLTSILRSSSSWWIAANVAGVLESGVLIWQILWHRDESPRPGQMTARVGLGLGLAVVVLLAFLPATAAAAIAFWSAMVLLFFINWPQIKKNHLEYARQGRTPSGIAWTSMAMVAAGSLLNLVPAFATRDLFWVTNSLVSALMSSIVLGQIFLPRLVSGMLRFVVGAIPRVERGARAGLRGSRLASLRPVFVDR